MTGFQVTIQSTNFLQRLPLEVLLYILKSFLDLSDLWNLTKVSGLRSHAITVLRKHWKIDVISSVSSSEAIMRGQCHAALIALEALSRHLILRTKVYNHFAFPPSLPAENAFRPQQDGYTVGFLWDDIPRHGNSINDRSDNRPSFPPTLEPDEFSDDSGFSIERVRYYSKQLKDLLQQEERLHNRIIRGISQSEDIHVRNRLFGVVDVIFHHAVFVGALSRKPVRLACTPASSNNRALAAIMARLLSQLQTAFPSNARDMTDALALNIKAFLEYTGYKLLAMTQQDDQQTVDNLIFCHLSGRQQQQHHPSYPRHPWPLQQVILSNPSQRQTSLLQTLQNISACCDLMGAAFIGRILKENHLRTTIKRMCVLLDEKHLVSVKRAILVDLMDGWLTINHALSTADLCRVIRLEIRKCNLPTSTILNPSPDIVSVPSDDESRAHAP